MILTHHPDHGLGTVRGFASAGSRAPAVPECDLVLIDWHSHTSGGGGWYRTDDEDLNLPALNDRGAVGPLHCVWPTSAPPVPTVRWDQAAWERFADGHRPEGYEGSRYDLRAWRAYCEAREADFVSAFYARHL